MREGIEYLFNLGRMEKNILKELISSKIQLISRTTQVILNKN